MIGCNKSPYKYKSYGKNPKPYQLIHYTDTYPPAQEEEYKTKIEIDKVVKDLLNGKPLKIIDDYGEVIDEVYPSRFYINKQIGKNYCAIKSS